MKWQHWILPLFFLTIALLEYVPTARADGPSAVAKAAVSFANGTPTPGGAPGTVTINVQWSGAPANCKINVSFWVVNPNGTYTFVGNSANNFGIAANGTWNFSKSGLPSGAQMVCRVSMIQFNKGPIVVSGYQPNPPLTVP